MTRYYLFTAMLFILSGCTSPDIMIKPKPNHTRHIAIIHNTTHYEEPTEDKMTRYQHTMRMIASGIKNDSQYRRIALDTPEKKEWFRMLTYRLWDRQITRQQFMTEGLAKYPTHKHEFAFIIKGFESPCQQH